MRNTLSKRRWERSFRFLAGLKGTVGLMAEMSMATPSITILVVTMLMWGCSRPTPPPAVQSPPTGQAASFSLGVNYPWLHYGHDFGDTAWGHDGASSAASKQEIETDFAYLKAQGVGVVRWFLFADCRAAPEFDASGNVTGLDEHFFPDFDTALAAAEKHDVHLIPVLLDFHLADEAKDSGGVQTGGRATMITDSAKRKAFLDIALRPLLERYGKSKSIIAWDVMNEPEGAMDIDGGRWVKEAVAPEAMKLFVNEAVQCIHTYSSQQATLGSASRGMLSNWTGCGLDLYQFHYYDKMESQWPLDFPCARISLDKPCIVGEFPTKKSQRTMPEHLDVIFRNGYAGALAWSYRGEDEASDFKAGSAMFAEWSKDHETAIMRK